MSEKDKGKHPHHSEGKIPNIVQLRQSRFRKGWAFMDDYEPPDWLVEGIVQRGRLYACTSLTGHGKTAVWLYIACMIQASRYVGNIETTPGNVLILAGENPEDLKARMHAWCASSVWRMTSCPMWWRAISP